MRSIKKVILFSLPLFAIACSTSNKTVAYDENSPAPKSQQQGSNRGGEDIFKMDTNKDGLLSKSEVKGPIANDFDKIDLNNDGFISKDELAKAPKPGRGSGGGGRPSQR